MTPDEADVTYEFFAPFAHVEGKYEWCRIRSPTHGVFDTFILLGASTAHPATVYVNSDEGGRFMRERYPECTCIRVPTDDLAITETEAGRVLEGHLAATDGPVRRADMRFIASTARPPRATSYGGTGAPVWGSSRYTCSGVDLNWPARVDGAITWSNGETEGLEQVAAIVTAGSFGRISPLTNGRRE